MLSKPYKTIIAVHNEDVHWFSSSPGNRGRQFFQMPLQQLLDDEAPLSPLPEWLKGNHKALCIIPDHWFGSQSFPFQSRKPSLIEPFLERKLISAHPGQSSIRHFFNYRRTGHGSQRRLSVSYFQEDKSYLFYKALRKLNHSPQQITAPAFLWEEALGQAIDDFGQLGTLVVHLTGKECQLYFYYQGLYQFSRSIMVSDEDDGLEALGYEINQSLYMFSQTAKNDLDRIYILCDSNQCREKLSELLGREVIDLKPLMALQSSEIFDMPQPAILNGWLKESHLHSRARFFSIMHRQLKKALEWRPVQWAGTIIGLVLIVGLIGEHFVLQTMYAKAENEYLSLQQSTIVESSSAELSEYPDTLDQVLNRVRHAMLVDEVHRLPAGFPDQVKLKKLEMIADPELSPMLKVAALVEARDAEALQLILEQLIAQLKGRFESTRNLTLNDFDISLNQSGDGSRLNCYLIDFTLELS